MALRIMDVLDRTARERRDAPALKAKRDGVWRPTTWWEYREQVRCAARAFMALGLAPGQCVTITGFNCPQWFVADLGAIHAGGIPAGVYTTSTAEQSAYIIRHCDAPIAVVEDAPQLAKLRSVWEPLPALRAVVLMHGDDPDERVWSWERFMALGARVEDAALDARIAAQAPDDVCTLIYTSGTTGVPKGVMLSHDNITWTADAGRTLADLKPGDDCISYLPLSHIAEQMVSLHLAMAIGACTWFAESMETLGENLRDVRPHFFLGVPRVWEKMQERMVAAGARAPALRKRIVRWARGVGLASGYAAQRGEHAPLARGVAERLVFSKVRTAVGLDRARVLATSAAPISRDTLEFFLSLGMPICEIYGMSECSGPATVSKPSRYRTGKVGYCLPGAELRIAEDGEICMRGRHVFSGYFKDAAGTAEALDSDGWLHSGDIGVLDAEGFLSITDRKKELIITAGGENVAPQYVEGVLKSIPVVSQAVVIGDRQRYLSVLLTLDPSKVPEVARVAGSPAHDVVSASRCERFAAYLAREIEAANARLARVQTVKRFAIVPGEFTVEGGELTPTLKLRRKVIEAKYAEVIAGLYGDS